MTAREKFFRYGTVMLASLVALTTVVSCGPAPARGEPGPVATPPPISTRTTESPEALPELEPSSEVEEVMGELQQILGPDYGIEYKEYFFDNELSWWRLNAQQSESKDIITNLEEKSLHGITYQWLIISPTGADDQVVAAQKLQNLAQFIGEKNGCFVTLDMMREAANQSGTPSKFLHKKIDEPEAKIKSEQRIGLLFSEPGDKLGTTIDGIVIINNESKNTKPLYASCKLTGVSGASWLEVAHPLVIVKGDVKTIPIEQR